MKNPESRLSDETIFESLRIDGGKSGEALGVLFDRYHRKLLSYFLRHGASRDEAEDLLQDTFARFVTSIRDGARPSGIGYLWRCAESVLLDKMKHDTAQMRDQRVTVALDDEHMASIATSSDDDHLMLDCIERNVRHYLQGHPERAEVISLIVHEEWKPGEIAEYLGRTVAATRQLIYECRQQLRALIQARCLEPSGGNPA